MSFDVLPIKAEQGADVLTDFLYSNGGFFHTDPDEDLLADEEVELEVFVEDQQLHDFCGSEGVSRDLVQVGEVQQSDSHALNLHLLV